MTSVHCTNSYTKAEGEENLRGCGRRRHSYSARAKFAHLRAAPHAGPSRRWDAPPPLPQAAKITAVAS